MKQNLSFNSVIEIPLPDKDHATSTDHETGKASPGPKSSYAIPMESHSSDKYQNNKAMKSSSLVIEDVTQGTAHGIRSSSSVVMYVEDEPTNESTTPNKMEVESPTPESDGEVNKFAFTYFFPFFVVVS